MPSRRTSAEPSPESAEELYDEAPCGYLSTTPNGTIVRVNQTLLDWTGYAAEELVGTRRFVDLLTAGGRIYHETHFAPLLRMQQSVREIALEVVCADGRRLPVLVNSVLKTDDSGTPQVIRTTVFNATDRQRYERELLHARREMERLLDQQRSVATTLQQSLLAGDPPEDARYRIATHYRPAVETLEVGGDWHDAFRLDADTVAISVGDVAGRGIDAATRMGQLRSAVRALALDRHGPAAVLERLERFADMISGPRMATIVYAEVGPGSVRFAAAGHPPPALVTDGEVRLLWGGRSAPLSAGGPRAEDTVELAPGGKILLYTDGLIERRDRPLDQGLDLLVAELQERARLAPDELVEVLSARLLADELGRDDVCLLCLERTRG